MDRIYFVRIVMQQWKKYDGIYCSTCKELVTPAEWLVVENAFKNDEIVEWRNDLQVAGTLEKYLS